MGMADEISVLESEIIEAVFIDNRNGKFVDELTWLELSNLEKETIKDHAKFDLDFIGISGSCQSVLSNNSVVQLLGHSSCKFYSSACTQIARCSNFKRILAYGKCGDYIFGEPMGPNDSKEDDETMNDSEEIEGIQTPTHRIQVIKYFF